MYTISAFVNAIKVAKSPDSSFNTPANDINMINTVIRYGISKNN